MRDWRQRTNRSCARLGKTELLLAPPELGASPFPKENVMTETKKKAAWHGIPRAVIPWAPHG
jgi:hypothetical protein